MQASDTFEVSKMMIKVSKIMIIVRKIMIIVEYASDTFEVHNEIMIIILLNNHNNHSNIEKPKN